MGCHGYPVTWDAIGLILSHAMNVCAPGAMTGGETKRHMVFECSALQHIRDNYFALFAGHNTMRSFMNQTNQRSINHFISECLDCSAHTYIQQAGIVIRRWGNGAGMS